MSEPIENQMHHYDERRHGFNPAYRSHRRGRVWIGLFLLIIGGLLFAREFGVPFPYWFFTWPMILIGLGLFIGLKHGFRRGGWFIPIIIGAVFLYDKIDAERSFRPYLWPTLLIGLGLYFILRPRRSDCWTDETTDPQQANTRNNERSTATQNYGEVKNDFIETTSVFGGIKKNVLSKNFKGGDIVNFMGGSEINLSQADFTGKVKIDVTNILGGAKLIVPPDWDVQSDVVTIFGGIDDKRQIAGQVIDTNKILILDGTCFFGGIEIKSF